MDIKQVDSKDDPVKLEHATFAASTEGPALRAIFTKCKECPCPTIYLDSDGNYAVQGYKVSGAERTGANLPDHEDVVKIPKEFFEEFLRSRGA